MKIVVIGGGWAGCAAALQAAGRGARVVLIERTDMLLGTGLVGGIMRNNGRFTAAEELIALGGGEMFQVIDANCLHTNISFPGHAHASLYNVATMEPIIRRLLADRGVELMMGSRVVDVEMNVGRLDAVKVKADGQTRAVSGDVFIEATGTAGPPANCNKYGNGCAMCVLRCHSFGGRVSVAAKAGVAEINARRGEALGAMSGSCKLNKESVAPEIIGTLNSEGVAVVPLPPAERLSGKLEIKACQQYALPEFEENIVLLNTGHAKLMSPFFPLEVLRRVPGFENARYEDPYSGGLGNSIRYLGMSPRDDALKVSGVDNLFCGGEKAGILVGHTEAICTGTLAGHNAVSLARGGEMLVLPKNTVIGDGIAFVRQRMATEDGLAAKYTFSGSVLFARMKDNRTYTTDVDEIKARVVRAGLEGVLAGC